MKSVSLSPKKVNIKKRYSLLFNRSNSISNNVKEIAIKKMALFGSNNYVDLNLVKNLDKSNKKFMEELSILNKANKLRDRNEKQIIINFLIRNNFNDVVINDLEYFQINIKKYINLILDYISLKEYGYLDIFYYDKDIPNNFYYILNDTKIGEYCLNITEDKIDFEDYFLYLNNLYLRYEKYKEKKIFFQKNNLCEKEEQNTFIDSNLIKKIISENNKTYFICSYNDIKEAKEIIIQTKIYNLILKNEANYIIEENDNSKYNDEIIQIHKNYNANLSILNYDKVLSEDISFKRFLVTVKNSVLSDSSIQYYLKMLNNREKNIIKKINYQKINTYKKCEYFGNFPLPIKNKNLEPRKLIARNETKSTLVICFNKGEYYNIINSILKEEKERNLYYLHEEYIFKCVNMEFFIKKIFSNFKLINNHKGDIIFSQNQKTNNFIILKEGIIELQMQNTSLSDLGEKINFIKDLLIKEIKENNISNKLLDSILELEMDKKTNLPMNFVKELINKKMNIIFSKCTRGFFGEYECYFKIPSLLTGIVVSEISEEYYYSYDKYKKLNSHSTALNEKLEEYSINKLINLLKRMFNIYNSYWRILNNQYNNLIKEDSDNNNNNNQKSNFNYINNNYDEVSYNNKNYDENYYKVENIDYKKGLSNNKNDDITKSKLSIPIMSQTILGKKFREIINYNMESSKNEKVLFKNKNNQIKSKNNIKKFHIKNWDFSINQNNYESLHSERLRSKNFNDINLIKNYKKNNNKNIDIAKSSLIKNNSIKTKVNPINKEKKPNKDNVKLLNNIILPPIKKRNENNNDNDLKHLSNIKSLEFKRNYNYLETDLNDEYKQNVESNYLYPGIDRKNKNNFDVKKVSINILKARKRKYISLVDNDDENDNSWREYYYTNQ